MQNHFISPSKIYFMKVYRLLAVFSLLLFAASNRSFSQGQHLPIDIAQLIDSISVTLKNNYVFSEKAVEIKKHLKKQLRTQAYASITDPNELAGKLISDIRQIHVDPHMQIQYDPVFAKLKQGEVKPSAEEIAQFKQYEKSQNYLFKKTEILPGNIGYLLLNGFTGDVESAKPVAASAFRFLSNTNAIIIDLRWNGGGDPEMVSYLESFFFKKKKLINTIIDRLGRDTTYFYADPAKANGLTLDMPVYILTSNRTFSGAEDFSYGMQNAERAIVIGETTGGGAHPTKAFLIGQGFRIGVPFARSWNPYTKTNWEGTGVIPDSLTSSAAALPVAQKAILGDFVKKATDDVEKRRLNWALNKLIADGNTTVPDSLDKFFPGIYTGGLQFYKKDGKFWCKNDELGGNIFQLAFIKDHLFVLDENVQVEFVTDKAGNPSRIFLLFQHGGIVEKFLENPGTEGKKTSAAQNEDDNKNTLSTYTGTYATSPNFVLNFKVINGELAVIPTGQEPIPIIRINGDVFADKHNKKVQMEFVRNANGSVEKVILNQNGKKMEAQRMESLESFDSDKTYAVEQLQSDLRTLKTILKENHPHLFEFISAEAFEHRFDSLSAIITDPLDEISFRYLLLPLIAQIHCGHTRLDPSLQLQQQQPTLFPPFVLYYKDDKAFVRFSANKDLLPGMEITATNGVSSSQRIRNLLERTTGDGIHRSVQYYLMNQPESWLANEMPFWYNVDRYQLDVTDATGQQLHLDVKAVDEPTFKQNIPPPPHRQHHLNILADKKAAILDYPTLDFPDTSIRNSFLEDTFAKLSAKRIDQLIIDLRGNGGGSPHNAAYFLRYLLPNSFTYGNAAPLPDLVELTKPIIPKESYFKGQVYFLIDGGCFSSTGHLLSLLQYHKIGKFIGETTSASYSCNTNGAPHTLPNTRLILFCPNHIYETAVKGLRRADGTIPDYDVKHTFDDILNGKDKVLAFALSIIDKNYR